MNIRTAPKADRLYVYASPYGGRTIVRTYGGRVVGWRVPGGEYVARSFKQVRAIMRSNGYALIVRKVIGL
jgi:hypothetical protein